MNGNLQIEYNLGTKPVITQFEVNKIGNLIATYSDTTAAIKVKNLEINKAGHLIVEGDDMAKVDLGSVVGPQGPKGDTPERKVRQDRREIPERKVRRDLEVLRQLFHLPTGIFTLIMTRPTPVLE